MRIIFGIVLAGFMIMTGKAWAEEAFQPQITLQELGQQCANTIGRYHVELQVAAVQASKYQAELARLKAEMAKAKDTEKK